MRVGTNTVAGPAPRRTDEATWELLRDEWELLMAIGSGPTPLPRLAQALGVTPESLPERLRPIEGASLALEGPEGWSLVPAVYERQEAMASFVRTMVLDRVRPGQGAPPLAMAVSVGSGPLTELPGLHQIADETALARVVALASEPEPEDAQRFVAVFASTTLPLGIPTSDLAALLATLRGAALQRARGEAEGLARLWVAELRVSPAVAEAVGQVLEDLVLRQRRASFGGAIAVSLWSVQPTGPVSGSPS